MSADGTWARAVQDDEEILKGLDEASAIAQEEMKWANAQTVVEYEVSNGTKYRVTKKVLKEKIMRPISAADLRAKLPKFGEGKNPREDLITMDPVVVLELGAVDPLVKACKDDVVRLWGEIETKDVKDRIKDPKLALYQKILAQKKKAAPVVVAAPVAAAASGEAMTWAQKREMTKAAQNPDVAKDVEKALTKNVVRVSNLSDFISEVELRRLFGTENNLPMIKKIFIAKDKTTGQRRGFAYITYATDNDGITVVNRMRRTAFKNTILTVDFGTDRN